jgi:hypothetical protein
LLGVEGVSLVLYFEVIVLSSDMMKT